MSGIGDAAMPMPTITSNRPPNITPAGWVSLSAAIAWIAQGTAVKNWNPAFYYGANYWPHMTPQQIAKTLRDLLDGNFERHRDFPYFARTANQLARAQAVIGPDECLWDVLNPASLHERAPAARAFVDEMIRSLDGKEDQYEAFWRASDTLRRAIAKGELPAFGFKGEAPEYHDASTPGGFAPVERPRERIPAEVCAAPVTLERAGIFPYARGDDAPGGFEYLWSKVLFDGEDLLRLRPASDLPSTPYVPQPQSDDGEPNEAERRGAGRKFDYDWEPFRQALKARVRVNCGGLTDKTLAAYLRNWVGENMLDCPDESSIRREFRKLVPRGLLPDK